MRKLLSFIEHIASKLPKNDLFWSYTITPENPLMTRILFPRIFGIRAMIHHMHRSDNQRDHMHNHPWKFAISLILSGGYTECRTDIFNFRKSWKTYLPGNLNLLLRKDFHKITEIEKDTWTFMITGPRVTKPKEESWGFLVYTYCRDILCDKAATHSVSRYGFVCEKHLNKELDKKVVQKLDIPGITIIPWMKYVSKHHG